MTTREAIGVLKDRGTSLTTWELRGLINRGEIPRPRLNTALKFDWSDEDVRNVEAAVATAKKETV